MGKNLKHVNGVFTQMVGTDKELSQFEMFLNQSPKTMSEDLRDYTNYYRNVVTKWKTQFDTVSLLEEIILQLRAKENITEVKLSVIRGEYIYARSPFYRRGGSTKDIRVIVGKTDLDGDDIDMLYKDPSFMRRAHDKIMVAMNSVIAENKNTYVKLNK
jgi:hypothetical protein